LPEYFEIERRWLGQRRASHRVMRWARGWLVAAVIAMACSAVYAVDGELELTVARLVDGLYQLRGADRKAELALVARGASREDADRFVRGLVDGFVRCLMNELKSYSAQQQESFSQRLHTVQGSLDEQGAASVLEDLLTLARAQTGSTDACGVDELKKIGVSVEALN
jgi:hypothetical protein